MTTTARAIRTVVKAICDIDDEAMKFSTRDGVPHHEEDVHLLLTMKNGVKVEIDIRAVRRSTI